MYNKHEWNVKKIVDDLSQAVYPTMKKKSFIFKFQMREERILFFCIESFNFYYIKWLIV